MEFIGYESAWMNSDLIPANTDIVEYSFENQSDITISDISTDEETGELNDSDLEVTKHSNGLCKDDYGNSICSVYVFQVANLADSPQVVSLNVVSVVNSFSSLNAMAYELAAPAADEESDYYPDDETGEFTNPLNGINDPIFKDGKDDATVGSLPVKDGNDNILAKASFNPVYVNRGGVIKTLLKYKEDSQTLVPAMDRALIPITVANEAAAEAQRTIRVADDVTVPGSSVSTFALVLYIKNENIDQTETDAEKSFQGKVIVNSGDGVGVSGTISAVSENTSLQSRPTQEPTPAPGNGTE